MSKELFIRKIYTKDGISVALDIDCESKTITFVERKGDGHYKPKKWVFEKRGREYLGGWVKILSAMEYAIKEADKYLKELDSRDEEKFVELLMEIRNPKLKSEKSND